MVSFSDEEYWTPGEDEAQEECQALQNINAWLESDTEKMYGPLTNLTSYATGNQVGMQANLYGGGFKRFDIDDFLAIVKEQTWHDPSCVQVFIKGEEDQQFTLLALGGLSP
jgi:hypothetical protein